MTDKRLRELCATWQKRLGLENWDVMIVVGHEHLDDDDFASCFRHRRYDQAVIAFAPWTLGNGKAPDVLEREYLSDELIEYKLVHELLHLVFRDLIDIFEDDLKGVVGREAFELLKASADRADEHAVDSLAKALTRNWGT